MLYTRHGTWSAYGMLASRDSVCYVPAADSISTLITRTLTLAPLDAVIAGVDRTESVGNLVLAAGLATKIWVVFLSPRISALVSLFEKLHKPPNARVLQKTVGFNGTN